MNGFFETIIEKYSKTAGVRTDVDRITTVALILQRIFGQQVLDPEWTWKKFFVHQLLNLILFVYVFFGTLECLKRTNDAELVAEACYTLIMIGIFPLKMLLFISNRFTFRELYVTAKTTLITVIQSDSVVKVDKVLKTSRKIVYVLFFMVLVPCSIYELTTLWNYVNGKRILLSRSTLTLMPMVTPYYELAWFFHSVFLFEISSTIILDMWFVLLIHFWCSASDSLAEILKVPSRADDETKASYAKRLNDSLRSFYKIHIQQVEYMNALSNMYKWLAFVPLCNAAMCTCLILLLMSKEINWRFAPHLLPMFAEIFAYNWFGEQIKIKAKDLHKTVIDFDWRNLTLQDQKSYYVIVTYMKKENSIKTAVGNELSLITMTAVLKVSYQAFTVLQSIDN
ncbi:uncharacterized protein LOC124532560 [Vanessa cardui]|uniref:uncharacterized protein LOC124532560 n=1 Tax=Vanessa cardui TaxID=171605 RepID=UPI001F1408DF|nr:uncharacterized protein LOC124532560 [Vanessa cardui]